MPKLRKEVEDKIAKLIQQGYKNVEVSEKLGVHRKTVANRRKAHLERKQDHRKPGPEKEEQIQQEQVALSDIAMSRLKQLREILGANSMEEMLETIYADQVAAKKYRMRYIVEFPGADAPKTFAEIIAAEEGYAADLKYDLDIYMKGFREDQELHPKFVYEGWNVSEFAGKPWIVLNCKKCGEAIFYGEGFEFNQWLFEVMPRIRRAITVTCSGCQLKPYSIIRVPVR